MITFGEELIQSAKERLAIAEGTVGQRCRR
jgi:hypothetical protein